MNAIEILDLSKRYGQTEVVSGLNLAVPQGSICGFLGRNGAGKTTTIKMLLGMTRPSAGEARVLGRSIINAQESIEIRGRTGFVCEDGGLYGYLTVAETIRLVRSFYARWRDDIEQRLMRDFELNYKRKVEKLSKGERAKLALILALARGAELLILDEPTASLDPAASEQALAALVSANAQDGATIFFSSHRIADIEQIADRVCIIERGRALLCDELDELKESYRHVRIAFEGAAPQLSLDGIERVERDGRWLSLLVSRNLDTIVAHARAHNACSVDVVPVTLKEIFVESVKAKER